MNAINASERNDDDRHLIYISRERREWADRILQFPKEWDKRQHTNVQLNFSLSHASFWHTSNLITKLQTSWIRLLRNGCQFPIRGIFRFKRLMSSWLPPSFFFNVLIAYAILGMTFHCHIWALGQIQYNQLPKYDLSHRNCFGICVNSMVSFFIVCVFKHLWSYCDFACANKNRMANIIF